MAGNTPDPHDDEYVAQLLAKDARESSLRYSTLGMNAFMPKRPSSAAPKPNTRFLKNILRETDSHNASLKRKEEEEARARMRALRDSRSSGSKQDRALYDVRAAKRRRVEGPSDRKYERERGRDSSRRERREDDGRYGSGDRDKNRRKREKRHSDDSEEEECRKHRSSHSRRHKDDRSRHRSSRRDAEYSRSSGKYRSEDGDQEESHHRRHKNHRHRSRSRSRSPERRSERRRGRTDDERHSHRRHRTSTSISRTKHPNNNKSPSQTPSAHDSPAPETQFQTHQSPTPSASDSDSDPLESLIGPLPPSANDVIPRGRGAYTSRQSNIDSHFASGYDPSLDIHPDNDDDNATTTTKKSTRRPVAGLATEDDDDDWDMALEALRDRALWKRKGAERLRQAGFEEGVVEKWAGNRAFAGLGGEGASRDRDGDGNVEDVRWAKRGEKREWDRGKVVDEEGHVDVRAEW
ncbi:hypothetical protein FQN50_006109 [Emmonsiellopsis sp. PD_5]|nr:hypothetical protein FQN50_006109 [Emmonsiellopsis sp. PD_5]